MAVVALAVIAVAVLLFVAYPLVRPPSAEDRVPTLTPEQRQRMELRERRDAAYAGLRELELEHRTGKLTEADYAAARDALRTEAIDALRALEALEPPERPEHEPAAQEPAGQAPARRSVPNAR